MVEDAMKESGQISEIGLQDFGSGSTTPIGVSKKELATKDILTPSQLDIVRQVASIADPTGILSWPDVKRDYDTYLQDTTLANAGWLLLSIVGAIPVLGKAATPAKAAKLAKTEKAVVAASKKIAKDWEKLVPLRAVDEAFDSGVMTVGAFSKWYKEINPKASRQEVMGAWEDVKRLFGGIESSDLDAAEMYAIVDSQFAKIVKKYNVGVDVRIPSGGWILSLAEANPKVYNKYIRDLDKIKKIPTQATGIAIGRGVAGMETKGSRILRTLFHEIGHLKFIENFPTVAEPFLKEYRALLLNRLKGLQSKAGLSADLNRFGDDLLNATLNPTKAYQRKNVQNLLQMGLNKQQILTLYQSAVLRSMVDQIGNADPKKIKQFLSATNKGDNYELFKDGMQEIAVLLDIDPGRVKSFYFLNFEEAFAELFEKTVRKSTGDSSVALSKNFPETSKQIQKIIKDEDIINQLKEECLKKEELDQLVENFLQPKPKGLGLDQLVQMIEEAMDAQLLNEEYYYYGNLNRPVDFDEVVSQMANLIKRKFPEDTRDMEYKKGKYVIQFSGLGDLQTRDAIIRAMADEGFLNSPKVKRANLYDTAQTNFVFAFKGKTERPVEVRFYHGGDGAHTSGEKYEKEVAEQLNNFFNKNKMPMEAKATGGFSKEPDIIITNKDTGAEVKIETKTKLGSDFGQFGVVLDSADGKFKMSKKHENDPVMKRVYANYIDNLDLPDGLPALDKSKEIMRKSVENIGTLIGDYYRDKGVSYIIVNDKIYSLIHPDPNAPEKDNKPEFDSSVTAGDVRFRVKNHGGGFSYTVALKPTAIGDAPNFLDKNTLDNLFNLTNPPQ